MKKQISIVVSAFNEEGGIEELARQLQNLFAQNCKYDFQVIIVENGSNDTTFQKLVKINLCDPRFKIVQLSRNFRMDGGVTAGLQYCTGDAAVIMTANLQDDPSVITKFIEKWECGYENVYGIVKKRTGKSFLRRINSQIFYFIINKMTDDVIPKNVSDFRLVDKKVYQTINCMHERNRFMRGMFAWAGFKSIGVEYERMARFAGKSHAHSLHVLQLAIQSVFAFSYVPIKFISGLGFVTSGLAMLYLAHTVVKTTFFGVPFDGYGTIVSLMALMFGLIFFSMGVLGQYIAQIYEEVKGRPNFIVCNEIGFDASQPEHHRISVKTQTDIFKNRILPKTPQVPIISERVKSPGTKTAEIEPLLNT